MKSMLIFVILFFGLLVSAAGQTTIDSQIISSQELEASGITLLSDMFQLFDKWNISSIDGFNWLVSSNGLSPFQRQRFKLMIDGHPVDINIMDNQNINLLPISINQINYVEVLSSPQIISNDFAEAGMVHIYLKKPEAKLTSHIVFSTGNETGDPGPYKFTSYSSPNIDKINTVLAGDLNYGSNSWDLQLGIKKEENYDTDSQIKKRIQYFQQSVEKARLTSGFGVFSILSGNSSHNLMSFYSDQNDYFHFKYFGNEIPVNRIVSLTTLNGNIQLNNRIKFNYLLQTGRNKLSEWNGPDPDWNNTKLRSDIGIEYQLKSFLISGGISLRKNTLETRKDLIQNSITFRNSFLEMKYLPGRNSIHKISFYTVGYKDKTSYKIALSNYIKLHRLHAFSGSISMFTRMVQEDLNFLSWNMNGYSLGIGNSWFSGYGEFEKAKTLTGDLTYKIGKDSSISAEFGFFYRKFEDQYLEDQHYFYNPDMGNFSSAIKIIPVNNFSEGGINAAIIQQLSSNFRYKINYTFRNPLTGNDLFNRVWDAFPIHKIALSLSYNPSFNFGIWSRLSYFSRSKWSEFAYVKYQSEGLYNGLYENGVIWDIALKKYFSNKLIRTNVVLRNILNQKEYYNPIGAEFNLRFFIQVIINLDNLPE